MNASSIATFKRHASYCRAVSATAVPTIARAHSICVHCGSPPSFWNTRRVRSVHCAMQPSIPSSPSTAASSKRCVTQRDRAGPVPRRLRTHVLQIERDCCSKPQSTRLGLCVVSMWTSAGLSLTDNKTKTPSGCYHPGARCRPAAARPARQSAPSGRAAPQANLAADPLGRSAAVGDRHRFCQRSTLPYRWSGCTA
jgi:hypothetical protein